MALLSRMEETMRTNDAKMDRLDTKVTQAVMTMDGKSETLQAEMNSKFAAL